jgi:hypothetical protein
MANFADFWSGMGDRTQTLQDLLTVEPSTGQRNVGSEDLGAPDESHYLNAIRQMYGIPGNVSDEQVKQWSQTQLPQILDANRKQGGGFLDQVMELAGPGSPVWNIGMDAVGGPIGGSISAASSSGAAKSLGINPALLSAGSMAYGAFNSPGGLGSTPSDAVAGSEYGAVSGNAPSVDYWKNTYAANDTGTMTDASPAGGNAPMFDDYGNPLMDDSGGLWNPGGGLTSSLPGMSGPGAFDEFGSMTGPGSNSTIFGGTSSNPFGGLDIMGLVQKYGPQVVSKLLGKVGIGGGNGGGASNPNDPLSGLLNMGARTAPGLAALLYANKQPGIDVGPLQGILGQLGGNQDAVIKAATDPVQQNIAGAYGDLLQSQGLRGIRGSSFGDTDISNFLSSSSRTLANAGANAAEGSLALQGNLAGNIANLKNQAQQIKNNLFGKAFDVLGRGLSPAPTFSLGGA